MHKLVRSRYFLVVLIIIAFFVGMLAQAIWSAGASYVVSPIPRVPFSGFMGMNYGVYIKSEADYLIKMIPHHAEAVSSAAYALTTTQDPEMRVFLQSLIDKQTGELEQMQNWYREWYGEDYVADDRYSPMMMNLQTIPEELVITAFLHGMVMHHIGAIDMSRSVLPIVEREELRSFAEDMIVFQSEEILRMLDWLSERAGFNHLLYH